MTNDDDPFFIQFYRKNDDPEVYGDENLPLLFGIDFKFKLITAAILSKIDIAHPTSPSDTDTSLHKM